MCEPSKRKWVEEDTNWFLHHSKLLETAIMVMNPLILLKTFLHCTYLDNMTLFQDGLLPNTYSE